MSAPPQNGTASEEPASNKFQGFGDIHNNGESNGKENGK